MNKLIKQCGTDKLSFVWFSDVGPTIKSGSINMLDNRILDMHTRFRIGSVTKPLTALVIMCLVKDKRLKLNDPISKWQLTKHIPKVTVMHLLTHTAGFPIMPKKYDRYADAKHYRNMQQVVSTFINEPIDEQQIGKRVYSNLGYMILGYIIEQITGKSWFSQLTKYVLRPLNMRDTGLGLQTDLYITKSGHTTRLPNLGDKDELWWASTAGGLYSTVSDLIKFAKGYRKLLTTPLIKMYMQCWTRDKDYIEHTGTIAGGAAVLRIYNDSRCYIFLSNIQHINIYNTILI